jgi:hypothetical protein
MAGPAVVGFHSRTFNVLRGRPRNGIEFDMAEIASGTTKTIGSIALDLEDSYFHFNALAGYFAEGH